MVQATIKLGGTAKDVSVGKIGHGLMGMTWTPNPVPDEQCFESIKAGIDSLPAGTKMFLNAGEFYAQGWGTANLEMIARFFEKYPEYADRAFLSVKGGVNQAIHGPDASPENLRKSVDNILRALRGTKHLDMFECARVDRKVPIEDQIKTLVALIKEGKFDHIGLSECKAETLRRAYAIHPITSVEIEVSPWAYEDETKKVIEAARELNVAVAAYSPVGRGFLTGKIKSIDDLPKDDMRRAFARFQPENFSHNLAIVNELEAIAKKKGCTPAQLSLAWVATLSPQMLPIPGSSHKTRTLENNASVNVDLTAEDLKAIEAVLEKHEVKGGRYFDGPDETFHLWG